MTYICKCGKEFENIYSFSAHKGHCKICNPNAKSNRYKNGIAWNKGLTKETDDRVKRYSETNKLNFILNNRIGSFKGKHHTEESKQKISKKLSMNNRGGRCKWYEYNGQKLQGTYELNLAKKFDEYNIKWKKIKTNKNPIKWIDDNNKIHHYTPDFYLIDYDKYIELKGYWWGNDKRKMELVKIQNQNYNIIIIENELYNQILSNEVNIFDILNKG